MTDKEEAFFRRRMEDLCSAAERKNVWTHSLFLNAEEQAVLKTMHLTAGDGRVLLAGGFCDAERRVVCFLPDYMEEIPEELFTCLKIRPLQPKFSEELSHRDFLGALMNLGIRREMMGDISVLNNEAHVVVLPGIAETIRQELRSVRHTTVTVEEERADDLVQSVRTEERSVNTASLRIDGLLSAVYGVSRQTAKELLKAGKVYLNSCLISDGSGSMKAGDILSVRGKGRFRLLPENHVTRKGRMFVHVEIFR